MPFLDSMKDNTYRGFALASVFGGGTSNSEWEFLTSNSFAFMRTGSPYQLQVKDNSYSIVSELKQRGYTCLGMHPYDENGWMRKKGYEKLGFDATYFLKDFPYQNVIRGYISDREMYEKIISLYENRENSAPMFVFGVTIQNHGGYTYDPALYPPTVHLEGMSNSYPDVEQYLSLINESDSAMEYLVDYFNNVEDEVVILFFGDHFPALNNTFFEEVKGSALQWQNINEYEQYHMVPFYIWANYDIEEKEVQLTSLNYLAGLLYEAAGMELPAYQKVLKEMQAKIPALNSFAYFSLDRQCFLPCIAAENGEKEALNYYWQLEYNNIYDEKNLLSIFR